MYFYIYTRILHNVRTCMNLVIHCKSTNLLISAVCDPLPCSHPECRLYPSLLYLREIYPRGHGIRQMFHLPEGTWLRGGFISFMHLYKLGTRTMLVLQWFSQPKLAFNNSCICHRYFRIKLDRLKSFCRQFDFFCLDFHILQLSHCFGKILNFFLVL